MDWLTLHKTSEALAATSVAETNKAKTKAIFLMLLLGDRLNPEERRAVGWALLAVGIVTTVPLLAQVFGKMQTISNPG